MRSTDEFVIDPLASACQIDYEHAKQYIVYKVYKDIIGFMLNEEKQLLVQLLDKMPK